MKIKPVAKFFILFLLVTTLFIIFMNYEGTSVKLTLAANIIALACLVFMANNMQILTPIFKGSTFLMTMTASTIAANLSITVWGIQPGWSTLWSVISFACATIATALSLLCASSSK